MTAEPARRPALDAVAAAAMDRTVRRGLGAVRVRGGLPSGPVVWAANHHCWWDPFVAAALLRRACRPMALLVDQDTVRRFAFARRVGAFGTQELGAGLAALRAGATLVVYPEGRLRAPGPLGPLAPGAAWYALRAGARLVAAATRVAVRGTQWPVAYVDLAEVPATGSPAHVSGTLGARLGDRLAGLDAALAGGDGRDTLPGYRTVVSGRVGWDERLDAMRGRLPWSVR